MRLFVCVRVCFCWRVCRRMWRVCEDVSVGVFGGVCVGGYVCVRVGARVYVCGCVCGWVFAFGCLCVYVYVCASV